MKTLENRELYWERKHPVTKEEVVVKKSYFDQCVEVLDLTPEKGFANLEDMELRIKVKKILLENKDAESVELEDSHAKKLTECEAMFKWGVNSESIVEFRKYIRDLNK